MIFKHFIDIIGYRNMDIRQRKKLVKEFNDKIGKNQSEYTIFLKRTC